jgi:hypothetical protein
VTDDEVIATATEYAVSSGRSVEAYDPVVAQREGTQAWVVFQGRSGQPGDHFSVVIDVDTGEAMRLVLGR